MARKKTVQDERRERFEDVIRRLKEAAEIARVEEKPMPERVRRIVEEAER